ncbi:hypothetical protein QBC32DRAFT_375387 [Pseudoneurospora amorphoporcata]|uniref:Uncharacterized protein n=1 Tax=Pseudoneurospora amorphoporcata TaxID=241081 RepID=A0AAN6SF43_9PEZI|nr:hypothetical protein QBC32DRAFT_375387 [Pseudoneurospora amorphoporcata]
MVELHRNLVHCAASCKAYGRINATGVGSNYTLSEDDYVVPAGFKEMWADMIDENDTNTEKGQENKEEEQKKENAAVAAPAPARTARDSSIEVEEQLDSRADPDLLYDSDDTDDSWADEGYDPYTDSFVVPSSPQTSFAVPARAPPAPQPTRGGRTSKKPAAAAAPRGRQPVAANASSASASVAAPAPAPAPSKKRKAPTGPPLPSRPFKRHQHLSPARTPAEVRRLAQAEDWALTLGFPGGRKPYTLPKLRQPFPYMPDPQCGSALTPSQAQNGYDAVKKHFDMAHARWEISVSKMASDATKMYQYGIMLRDEAHASHRWVRQIGTQTWGEDGRMKNYDAFVDAVKKVEEMAEKARELVKRVEGDVRRFSMEFAKKRRDWEEEEISATEESE